MENYEINGVLDICICLYVCKKFYMLGVGWYVWRWDLDLGLRIHEYVCIFFLSNKHLNEKMDRYTSSAYISILVDIIPPFFLLLFHFHGR